MDNRFEVSLKQRNLRITESRQSIYKVLSESHHSLSAKDIYEIIKDQDDIRTDQASVYRNLTLFSEIGLAHKLQGGKYSACTHSHGEHRHLHILANCSSCAKTFEISTHNKDICDMAKQIQALVGSFSNFSGVTLQGVCKDCVDS